MKDYFYCLDRKPLILFSNKNALSYFIRKIKGNYYLYKAWYDPDLGRKR